MKQQAEVVDIAEDKVKKVITHFAHSHAHKKELAQTQVDFLSWFPL